MNTNLLAPWGARPGILADDLTGACDCAVYFAERGFSTVVWLDPEKADAGKQDLDVLITESRSDPPKTAAAKTRAACSLLSGVLFKKIDSTMRGNPGWEIAAVLDATASPLAMVCPAFPEMGRVVEDGWLRAPGLDLYLPDLLAGQGLGSTRMVVAGAVVRSQLVELAACALRMRPRPLLAGSAGLAWALAATLAPAGRVAATEPPPAGPVLAAIGSTHPATEAQVRLLAAGARPHRYCQVDWSLPPDLRLDAFRAAASEGRPGCLVLSGGDTASLVCRDLGVEGIRLVGEIVPGIPWGRLAGGPWEGCAVVTKAGGFGREDALLRIMDFIRL